MQTATPVFIVQGLASLRREDWTRPACERVQWYQFSQMGLRAALYDANDKAILPNVWPDAPGQFELQGLTRCAFRSAHK